MAKYVASEALKRTRWREVAVCRDDDPELFFPVGNSGPALLQIEQARKVCRDCPAIGYCALFAFETGQDSGVWGGMSEDERRAHKRQNPGTDQTVLAQALQNRFADTHPGAAQLLPPIVPPEEPEASLEDTSDGPVPTPTAQYFRA
jgi:WhiB family transcriptional regulator, redox-sensing transcriptional regulator